MQKNKLRVLVITWALLISGLAGASAQPTGKKIVEDMISANRGFLGEKSSIQMVLIDSHGKKVFRSLEGKVKEISHNEEAALFTFLSPLDVRGTKMLTRSKDNSNDNQWIYLPALRRVKRIFSSHRGASFMGSEFSYEDLSIQRLGRYNYRLLREERYENQGIWVLERTPKEKSVYSKQIMYVAKNYMNTLKIEYFDRGGQLLKIALFINYQSFQVGQKTFYRAEKIHMKNLLTKRESQLIWTNRDVGVQLSEREFSQSGLKE